MPKRKSKSSPRGTPATPPGRVTREVSTGIYSHTTRRASTPEDMEAMLRAMAERRDLDTLLDRIDVACREHLKPHAKNRVQDLPEDARRARDCADHIKAIKHALSRGDSRSAVYEAVQLGMAVERLGVLPWEKFAADGLSSEVGRDKGHKTRSEKASKRRAEVCEWVERWFREHPAKRMAACKMAAYKSAAAGCRVPLSTVRKYWREYIKAHPDCSLAASEH